VLSLPDRARFAVVEMGSNHPGELAQLCAVVRPDLGCVVSIGPEHLEGFVDLAGVAREECALFTALPAGAPAFLGTHALATQAEANATTAEALLAIARTAAAGRDLHLSAEPPAAAATGEILSTPAGSAQLALLGAHNRANAWLAWQVAVAAGIDGRAALNGIASVRAAPGRLRPVACAGHLLIDDSYNANPASMQAGLGVLAARPGRRLAILGHMGELGEASAHGHALVGTLAARLGVALIAVGPLAQPIHAAYRAAGGADGSHVPDHAGAIAAANAWLATGTATVLVKGSRSAHLEVVVAGICTAHGARAPGGVH
jgi:UDP-N-acetylmuramoyl-tripeptide--D-alanyl-D-alanine ligase